MKSSALLFFFTFLSFTVSGQLKKTYTLIRDTFPDGKVKQTTETWTKETREFNLHTYVKTVKKIITRYYQNGKIWYRLTYHSSMGPDEKPCAELYFKQEEYWDNGNKKAYMRIECDCHLYIYKEWNRNEKLLNKTRSKIKRYY